jgi:hypothetical protein
MGILMKPATSTRAALAAHCLVGRSSACTLRLDEPKASAEHARIAWADGAWCVRDLGSRNGTWVDGVRLDPGGSAKLAAGARIAFGHASEVWVLEDASPPVAMARRLAGDTMVAAEGGMLALPSADAPSACVIERSGAWVVEIDGQARRADDGEVIQAGGEAFMLHLPVAPSSTIDAAVRRAGIADAEVHIRVTADEEHVEVTVSWPGGAQVLPPRSHHYTLLTLARARLREEAARPLAEGQLGWIAVDELCRALAMDEGRLNVEIYRIRQDFGALGLEGAAGVIERRRGSRQLRFAAPRVKVTRIE